MNIIEESIDHNRGIRVQTIKNNDSIWSILCNDRFEKNEFKTELTCDICKPTYVPKVINYRGNLLCTACLTRMIEMIQMATLSDCGRDRKQTKELQIKLETAKNG